MPNDSSSRCRCPRCTIRNLRGPAVLITVGILFLLDQMHGSYYLSFHNTWPMILVVLGVISLASALAPMDGHIPDLVNNPNIPPPMPPPPPGSVPPSSLPPGSISGQGR
jgi:hypothetical protein